MKSKQMDRLSELFNYDPSSVMAALICLILFWTLVTVFAVLTRRLLLHFSFRQVASFLNSHCRNSTTWCQSLHAWISEVCLSHALQLALLDSLATFEICACSMECWTVRAAVGQTGLLIAIAANGIRGFLFTCGDAYGNPCTPFYRYLHGRTSATWVGITWGMQIIAAFFALHVAEMWWSLHPTVYHSLRHKLALEISDARFSSKPNSIQSDLQVSVWCGFLIETTGVFVDFALATLFACVIDRWNVRHQNPVLCSPVACSDKLVSNRDANDQCRTDHCSHLTPSRLQLWGSFALRLCINLFLTAQCIGLTGLYVNPANAFIQSWGLGDVSSLSHICVYWLGPFCGVWLSVQFERWLAGPVAETHSSLIFQSFKVLRSTTATQTVQEAAVLTETNSSTSSSLRDLPQNVGPCGPSSSKFDSHSVEHENSSDGFTNKFGLLGLPIS
ncbi:hypothetical protein FBUS_09145 [Fasciolopsis buskii]|uniref:Uncharacterized protein n=1 Tax=Fasciolopsis buskii TaxID=27845 RepID=A0A8E0RY36_9TREM|nr:hypothetical protein FBUS_09145 [Fasciolopsis buski]